MQTVNGRVRQDAGEHTIYDDHVRWQTREHRREVIRQALIHPDGAHQETLPLGGRLGWCVIPVRAACKGRESEARRFDPASLSLFAEKRDRMPVLGECAGDAQRWRDIPASVPGDEYKG